MSATGSPWPPARCSSRHLTSDPFVVSMALLAQQLPNLLFGLPAGAIADRYDRRRIVAAVNLARAAVLAVLAATLVGGA